MSPTSKLSGSFVTEVTPITTTEDYDILRQHIHSCKDIPPTSFVSRVILSRLDEQEGALSTLTSTSNDDIMVSSSISSETESEENFSCSVNSTVGKDISILQQYIRSCKTVPPSSDISRAILSSLDEHSRQLKTSSIHKPSSFPKGKKHSKPPTVTLSNTNQPRILLLRFLLLDTPLAALFLLFLFTSITYLYFSTYLTAILKSSDWVTPTSTGRFRLENEFTYYERRCDASDVTTSSMEDLTLQEGYRDGDEDEAVEKFMVHGAVVLPKLLGEGTAEELRKHILKRNSELTADESIPLDGPEKRYSYGIGVNEHPSVAKAIKEIASNNLLTKSLTKLLGPNPAIAEITAITVEYGAFDQGWHSDVKAEGNSVKYSRTFTHSYSLFVPLQNVTVEMGATEICPGTHMCPNYLDETCSRVGFPAVPYRDTRGSEAVWRTGDALIMNQCMWHRGPAHTDPTAPSRVVFILTFLSRPDPAKDPRQLSHGTYFHIRPDMYGFTLNDLRDPGLRMKAPFSWLRSLGVWKPKGADWGWDWPTMTLLRISNEQNGYHPKDLPRFVRDHGLAKTIPQLLHGGVKDRKHGGWPRYLRETVWNFKIASGVVYALVFGVYFVIVLLFDMASTTGSCDRRWRTWRCLSLLKRTLVLDLILGLLAYRMYQDFLDSSWIKSIETGVAFRRPFTGRSTKEEVENYDFSSDSAILSTSLSLLSPQRYPVGPKLTTVPDRMDILFSRRFDSKHIGYYRHYLDYHPGNARLNADLAQKSDTYNSYSQVPDIFGHRIVEGIINNVYRTGSRFLSQNDFGEWTVMDRWEVEEIVKRRLLWSEHGLFAALDDELSFLIAANNEEKKHNEGGGSFRRMAEENLARWKMTFHNKLMAVGAVTTTGKHNLIEQNRKLQKIFPPSPFELSSHAKQPSIRSKLLATKIITRSKSGTLKQRHLTLNVGDKVWANDGGEESDWHAATVFQITDEGIVVGLEGKKGRKHRFITSHDLIYPYQSLTQGDSVEVYFPDEDVYIMGVIVRAYPDRTYDILYWEEDDETEVLVYRIPDDRINIFFPSDNDTMSSSST